MSETLFDMRLEADEPRGPQIAANRKIRTQLEQITIDKNNGFQVFQKDRHSNPVGKMFRYLDELTGAVPDGSGRLGNVGLTRTALVALPNGVAVLYTMATNPVFDRRPTMAHVLTSNGDEGYKLAESIPADDLGTILLTPDQAVVHGWVTANLGENRVAVPESNSLHEWYEAVQRGVDAGLRA